MMSWKEIFIEKMFVEKDIQKGLMLYVENQPETIFRYRSGSENDKNALLNDQIWLSNMKCVNDKFEGQLEIYVQRALLAGIVCGREAGKANCTKIVSDTK